MNSISAIFIIMGSFIGAGFSTGKEIFVFFGTYGFIGLANLLLSVFIFYFVLVNYLKIGKKQKINNFSDINTTLVSKPKILDFMIIFCFLIVTSALFAGANEFDKFVFVVDHKLSIFGIITLVVSILIAIKGLKGLARFCNIVVPIILVFFLTICVLALFTRKEIVLSEYCFKNGVVISVCNAISYVGHNSILSSQILFDLGGQVKNIKKVVLFSVFIFGSLIFVAILTLVTSDVTILISSMPLLSIAMGINKYLGYGYIVIMWLAIVTSLIANIYSVSNYFNQFQKRNWLNVICVSIICYLFSFIGFGVIVEFSYPLIGVFGMLYYFMLKNKHMNKIFIQSNKRINIHKKA